MESFYWDETRMKNDGANPTILAIGDSWFWYLLVGGSLINHLGPIVNKNKQNIIYVKGANGAEAFDYVDGKYARIVLEALRLYGSALNAVFLSGGGNDFAGFNDLRPLLKDDCTKETTAKNCFRGGTTGLAGFLDRMDEYYRKLIGVIYTRTKPECLIVMHTYDYGISNKDGAPGGGTWLEPALHSAGVPPELHQDCINFLLDSFYDMLIKITKMDPKHLFVVDSRKTLASSDWANELHPKASGFKKIAYEKWKPVLETLGLA